ncbi:hypothetical protein FQN51_005397 [Onygenales sp. PD_10]|nr:hypothetical protein FQN51_005397 [Onygenales sp. PD_10]
MHRGRGYNNDSPQGRGRGRGRGDRDRGRGYSPRGDFNQPPWTGSPTRSDATQQPRRGRGQYRSESPWDRGSWRGSSRGSSAGPGRRPDSPASPDRSGWQGVRSFDGGRHEPSRTVREAEDAIVKAMNGASGDDEELPSLSNLSIKNTSPLPPRPNYGVEGREMKLWANYFELQNPVNATLYQHSIRLPDSLTSSPRAKRRLFSLLLQQPALKGRNIATNYVDKLICTERLDDQTIEVKYYEEDAPNDSTEPSPQYPLRLRYDKEFHLRYIIGDLSSVTETIDPARKTEAIQALNIVLASFPNQSQNVQDVGQSKHFALNQAEQNQDQNQSLGGGLKALRGFFHSVRPSTGRLLLNLNVSTAAFYNGGSLTDLINAFLLENRYLTPFHRNAELDRFLKKLRVTTSHLKRTKTIFSLVYSGDRLGTAGGTRFLLEKSETGSRDVTVKEYFQQVYNIEIDSAGLLVNVGTRTKPTYLPTDICEIVPGQVARQRLSSAQTTRMINIACRRPADNARNIVSDGLPLMGVRQGQTAIGPQNFGITISPQMLAVTGRLLAVPQLIYKNQMPAKRGFWNLQNLNFNRAGRFPTSGRLKCLILTTDGRHNDHHDHHADTEQFMLKLRRNLNDYGINTWPSNPIIETIPLNPHTMEEQLSTAFSHAKGQKVTFCIISLPQGDSELYSRVKLQGDVRHGIHTVCVVRKQHELNKGTMYLANLALKINLKLGGVNHTLTPRCNAIEPGTMFVGIDVTHPTGTEAVAQAPSIAGVVANDDDTLGQWPASLRTQGHREEMVEAVGEMVKERVKAWRGARLERIVIFRDGVSETQYEQVLERELRPVLAALKGCGLSALPKVTLVIVGKRHHTRFYPGPQAESDGSSGNVPPGTVVDRGCTMERKHDFFMVAHSGIKGTSRPAHYVVLHDDNHLGADQLQALTYNLCYLFGRATRSVSIVPPAYYADILCERGRCYLYDVFHPKGAMGSSQPYDAATSGWLLGVHRDLEGSMFYI